MRIAFCLLIAAALSTSLAACERAKQDMYKQPKFKPFRPSDMFADGNSSRPLPPGTVPYAMGAFAGTSSGRVGEVEAAKQIDAEAAQRMPYPVTMELLKRGQNRYEIYCLPCHSPLGDGDGLIARRGFPHPPSYHIDRLRQAPDRHFYDVITNGYGIMYSYAGRIEPSDRWAIVAYIRALQFSRHADARKLPPDMAQKLTANGEQGEAR